MEDIKNQLANKQTIEKKDIIRLARKQKPNFSEKSTYWLINQMISDNIIRRVGPGKYWVVEKEETVEYIYHPSEKAREIIEKAKKRFPLMKFQVWESIQYNYFANHQISNNTIFFETNRMLLESVFEFFKNEGKETVLLSPSKREYMRYASMNTIVVQGEITEAPKGKKGTHLVPIEKLLIDTLTDKIAILLFSKNERDKIVQEISSRYNVNIAKAMRYAKRRNAEERLRFILKRVNEEREIGENT